MRIFKRGDTWSFVLDVGKDPKTGKRKQKTKGGFKRKKDAEEAAVKLREELTNGIQPLSDRCTFEELGEMWLVAYERRNQVKPSTIRVRVHERMAWLKHFRKIDVHQLNRHMIQDALNQMSKEYAPNTLSGILSTLRKILRFGKEQGFLKQDHSEFVYMPKKRKTLAETSNEDITLKYMEKTTLKELLGCTKRFGLDHDLAMFTLLAYTGMRIGEALALQWSDINFDEQTIAIRKTMYNPKNNLRGYQLETPKTESSNRTIVVDPELLELLKQVQRKQKEMRFKYRDAYDKQFVFVSYQEKTAGYPLTNKTVTCRLQRLLKIAKIQQHITLHTFRHTHTSLLAEAGVGLIEIMERLGHKDDSITRDVYLHVTKQLKKEAVHKFSKLMNDL